MTGEVADIAVIGGGAAGLAAAIFAAEAGPGRRIVVLDGAAKLGAKILVSGGGRCNVTHDRVTPGDFNGPTNLVRRVLAGFDQPRTVQWFDSMGVALKREPTGKLFPVTNSAHTVLDALLRRCADLGVQLATDWRVREIAAGFVVHGEHDLLHARRVIMATGGRSLPRTGSDGAGWAIVQRLGHTVTPTFPALVPLVLRDGFGHAELSGLSLDVTLRTWAGGKRVDQRTGSLLWTHFGVSGPVAMDASRHWIAARTGNAQPVALRACLLPGQTFDAVERQLVEETGRRPRRPVADLLRPWMPARLAGAVCPWAGIDPATPLGQLRREDRRTLVHRLTELDLPVERDRGWNHAEVTAGGVPLSEIDTRTMASRRTPGLYLVGEMLDCDGRIGGFNFQWAWSTGHLAGRSAAASLATPVSTENTT